MNLKFLAFGVSIPGLVDSDYIYIRIYPPAASEDLLKPQLRLHTTCLYLKTPAASDQK